MATLKQRIDAVYDRYQEGFTNIANALLRRDVSHIGFEHSLSDLAVMVDNMYPGIDDKTYTQGREVFFNGKGYYVKAIVNLGVTSIPPGTKCTLYLVHEKEDHELTASVYISVGGRNCYDFVTLLTTLGTGVMIQRNNSDVTVRGVFMA